MPWRVRRSRLEPTEDVAQRSHQASRLMVACSHCTASCDEHVADEPQHLYGEV